VCNAAGAGYMFLYNVLDFPAGVVRMTKQTAQDIEDLRYYTPNKSFKLQEEIKEVWRYLHATNKNLTYYY